MSSIRCSARFAPRWLRVAFGVDGFRGPRWSAFAAGSILALAAACSNGQGTTAATPTPFSPDVRCGRATALEETPAGSETAPGARAGPIWFVFGGTSKRARYTLQPDYPRKIFPSKVLVVIGNGSLERAVRIRGWRCGTGSPLRFWYRRQTTEVPLSENPASPAEMKHVGDLVAILGGEPTILSPPGYHGFILFPAPGRWKVAVYDQGRLAGAVVIRVVAA